MKKVLLLIGLHLLLCPLVFGQTDEINCAVLVQGEDYDCSAIANCTTLEGCSFYKFRAECAGTYTLSALVTCSETNCGHCAACVTIYSDPPGANPVASCNTLTICEQNNCLRSCQVNIGAAGDYIMYVCLTSCTSNSGDIQACCEEDNGCKAHGCIHNGSSSTCP